MPKLTLPALNVQAPWAELILSGKKTIETRRYPLPKAYQGHEMYIIETPGRLKGVKRKIVGIVKFSYSFQYQSRQHFYQDRDKHHVGPTSNFAWKAPDKTKRWGWVVETVRRCQGEVPHTKKCGIVFTQALNADVSFTLKQ